MTNEEIYKEFCKLGIKHSDYRPLSAELVMGKQGITVWLENGDIIIYFPKIKTDYMQITTEDVLKIAKNMKNNRLTETNFCSYAERKEAEE